MSNTDNIMADNKSNQSVSKTIKYSVEGMSCAACQARVEKAVTKVEGVDSVSVSLLTNSMGVTGNANPREVISAVEKAGYGAEEISSSNSKSASSGTESIDKQAERLENKEVPVLKRRLIISAVFLLVLMYFTMGHMMLGLPVPSFFNGNHIAMGLLEMVLAAIVMLVNKKFFTSGFSSLLHRAPNMDTLVAMGSMTSFVWSVIMLFKMTADQMNGDMDAVMADMNSFYFESAAMIVALITVGKLLEALSKGRTTDALKSLLSLASKKAIILVDGTEKEIPIEEVRVGDVFIVRPGGSVPVDGVIKTGATSINESALTGESIPVDKAEGDMISAATINGEGYITAEATRVGEDTTLSQIIKMVSDASSTKAPIARVADKVSGIFVPAVITIAIIVTALWLITGHEVGYALARGIAVLVISCPCALGLATPVAIMVGNGKGAKNGVLFRTAASLEEAGKTEIIALDKTGTVTNGIPEVSDIIASNEARERTLLEIAYSLEKLSEHPLAGAVVRHAENNSVSESIGDITDFKVLPGNGLQGVLNGEEVYGGKKEFIENIVSVPKEIADKAKDFSKEGKTCLYFARGKELLGMISASDTIKEESKAAISELKGMGVRIVMLTGDNEDTAKEIARQAGIDEVIAGLLPEEKQNAIKELKEFGKVAMVGDGINDAPALTEADTGIAIGAGTDVAIDAAEIVLVNSKLSDVPAAVRLSRATLKNIHENLFWAFIYNVLLIPLAAGAYTLWLHGWTMNPMIAAAAMSLSSFSVCMNALRLNLLKIYDSSNDKAIKKRSRGNTNENEIKKPKQKQNEETKGGKKMTKTIEIKGMMCEHCEAAVKKALLAVDGVADAKVSHEEGTAVVELSKDVSDGALKTAVEDKDYEVVSVK